MRIKKFRSAVCIALSILLVMTNFVYADTAKAEVAKCPDIVGNMYEAQLREWVDNGFIKGAPDGNFKPENTITRAEFMALVNRSFGFTESIEISFSDVLKNNWFYKDAAIAVKTGYMQGSNGKLTPQDPITRQEFAMVLARLTGNASAVDDKVISGLSDGKSIPEWSRAAISTAVGKGYFEGLVDKGFKPTEKISRLETVVALDRAFKGMYKAVYSKKGTYGPASGIQTLDGGAVIVSPDVTLKNTTINGDLILRESIGDGNVYLDNVVVKGTTIVKGGGEHSIVISNSSLGRVIVRREGNVVRIVATGSTTIGEVDMQSGATLHEEFLTGGGFGDVVIPDDFFAGATVVFEGIFDDIQVDSSNANINVGSGTIGNLTLAPESTGTTVNLSQQSSVGTLNLNAAVNITGQGTIQTANVNASGSTMQQQPQNVVTAPGVTVVTNNPAPTQTPTPTPTSAPTPTPAPATTGGGGSGGNGHNNRPTPTVELNAIGNIEITKDDYAEVTVVSVPSDAIKAVTSTKRNLVEVAVVGNKIRVTGISPGIDTITVTASKDGYRSTSTQFTVNVKPRSYTGGAALAFVRPLDFSVGKWSNVSGYNVGFELLLRKADVRSISVSLYKGNEILSTNTDKPALLSLGTSLSSPFDVNGSFTGDQYWTYGGWDKPVNKVPEKAVIKVTDKDYNTYTVENTNLSGDPSIIYNVTGDEALACVQPENFNTHSGADYKGINVGFRLESLSLADLADVEISLYSEDTVLAENTSIIEKFRTLPTGTKQFGTPFIVKEGTYVEEYWTFDSNTLEETVKPDRAVIKVTDLDGYTYIVENDNLVEPNGVAYVKLFAQNYTGAEALAKVEPTDFSAGKWSNVSGYNVGFNLLINAADVESIEISLYKDTEVLSTNTSKPALLALGTVLSSPFNVNGSFEGDEYWTYGGWNKPSNIVPDKAVIKVIDKEDNTYTVENTNLSGDPSIIPTNEEAVALDAAAIAIGYASGDSAESVTQNLTLPTAGAMGSQISWRSSNYNVIRHATPFSPNDNGKISRPIVNTIVTLTATIVKGTVIVDKDFTVTVKGDDTTAEAVAVQSDYAALEIGYATGDSETSVKNNLTLSSMGASGSVITWDSSDNTIIGDVVTPFGGNLGKVTRPAIGEENSEITLTAIITRGGASKIKEFTVKVMARTELIINVTNPDNGTITPSEVSYCIGDNVTITAIPEEGYVLGDVTITNGATPLDYTRDTNTITFIMPRGSVNVTADFPEELVVRQLSSTRSNTVDTSKNTINNFGWFSVALSSPLDLSTDSKGNFAISYEFSTDGGVNWEQAGNTQGIAFFKDKTWSGYLNNADGVSRYPGPGYSGYVVPAGVPIMSNETKVGERVTNAYNAIIAANANVMVRTVLNITDNYGNKLNPIEFEPVTFTNSEPDNRGIGIYDKAQSGEYIVVSNINELKNVLNNPVDGQTWVVLPGIYNVLRDTATLRDNDGKVVASGGQAGWYIPITADGLTVIGVGNPVITSSEFIENGAWASQNLITVWGDDVTFKGLTITPKAETNKSIEVVGDKKFTIEGCTFVPNEVAPGAVATKGGSLYFNGVGKTGTNTIEVKNNTFNYTTVAFDGVEGSDITILGNTFEHIASGAYAVGNTYWGSAERKTTQYANVKVNGNNFNDVTDSTKIIAARLNQTFTLDAENKVNDIAIDKDNFAKYINFDNLTYWSECKNNKVVVVDVTYESPYKDVDVYVTNVSQLTTAINAAQAGDVIMAAAGTYGLTEQLNITKPISIIGEGEVILKAVNNSWNTENGYKHLLAIYAGTEAAPVTISNITIDADGKSHAVNTYNNAYGILNDVTIINGKGAGLIVNGSTIEANNLNTSGNVWGAVNVDPGVGVDTPSVFILDEGILEEGTQIWSDGRNVGESATIEVTAVGYTMYPVGDEGEGFIWTNKELSNVASITRNIAGTPVTTVYTTIKAAIDAAVAGDTVDVAAGTYKEDIIVNKEVIISGAGADVTKLIATDGNKTPLTFAANGATVSGFTITHKYTPEELTNWNFNNNGVIFLQLTSGNTLSDCIVELNRNGVYLNNCQGNKIIGNTITNNRTGINMTNKVNGTEITGNTISDNWTVGLVFYCMTIDSNLQADLSTVTVENNIFDENWYTEILIKDAPNCAGILDVSGNTFEDVPVTYTTSADLGLSEPGFADQKPSVEGIEGPATKPAEELPTLRIYNSGTVQLVYNHEKTLNVGVNEPYKTLGTAVNDAQAGDVIIVAAGTYGLTEQLNITKPISIIGEGEVTLKAVNDSWNTENGYKHLLAIYAGTEAAPVTISNIIIDADGKSHAVNTFDNAYGILNDVTIRNGKGAGLTVNGSTVVATNLKTSGNVWGAVNVDPGSGVETASVFTLSGGMLEEGTQIWSDGSNVSENASVDVTADGYNRYAVGGGTAAFFWTDRELPYAATITNGDTTYYTSIQAAIDSAQIGDTINVAAGTFAEQLEISEDITLIGTGESTIIQAPDSLETKFTTSADNKPVIFINNAAPTIKNLIVDGAGKGNANYRIVGIGVYNAGGIIDGVEVKAIRNTPLDGMQHGIGIFAYNGDGAERQLSVRNCNIKDYQKNGMTFSGANLTVSVTDNTVNGAGKTPLIAQNGIQISGGATGTVEDNIITGNWYNRDEDWSSTGILVYDAAGMDISDITGNTLENNQVAVCITDSSDTDSKYYYIVPENFNTHSGADYRGINVGFSLGENLDISQLKSVEVSLYNADGCLVTNTANDSFLDLPDTEKKHSTPFIVQNGSYNEEFWNLGEDDLSVGIKPSTALIKVVDVNGNSYLMENDNLVEADGITYNGLFDYPRLTGATVSGNILNLRYDRELAYVLPDASDFTAKVNGVEVGVCGTSDGDDYNNPGIWDDTLCLYLSIDTIITSEDEVEISYTPGTNPIQDLSGNTASSLKNEVVDNITPDADEYEVSEADNTLACFIDINESQSHTISPAGDFDVLYFEVTDITKTYTIRTSNLSADMDTYLYLYFNEVEVTKNDDIEVGDLSSLIEFTPGAVGTYFVYVEHYDELYGAGSYDISVTAEATDTSGGGGGTTHPSMSLTTESIDANEPIEVDFVVEPQEKESKVRE